MTATAAFTIPSSATPAVCFIDVDVRDLPILWEEMLRQAVNDYVCREESDSVYLNAERWLFYEEYHPELDGRDFTDICSLHVVGEAFNLDLEKVRFDIQCMRDTGGAEECQENNGIITVRSRGRRQGHIEEGPFGELLVRWKRKS